MFRELMIPNSWICVQITTTLKPFPSYRRRFLMPLKQTTFENIVAREEIAKQLLLLPQCFPLLAIDYLFNYKDFPLFDKISSKSSAADFLYVGKGQDNWILFRNI